MTNEEQPKKGNNMRNRNPETERLVRSPESDELDKLNNEVDTSTAFFTKEDMRKEVELFRIFGKSTYQPTQKTEQKEEITFNCINCSIL